MSETRRKYENFNLYDYRGVEAHLSRMAAKGWRLEFAGGWFWTYRRAEPADVRYAVTYNRSVSQFDPGPTEEQEVLTDLCEAAGWKAVSNWNQMQIFETEDPDAVPLETDEALRLEVIHRTMKKSVLPITFVFLALGLLMFLSSVSTLVRTPLRFFGSNGRMFCMLMYLLIVILMLGSLGAYWFWYRKSAKAVAEGGTCASQWPGYRKASLAGLIAVLLLTAGYAVLEAVTTGVRYALFYVAYTGALLLLMLLVNTVKNTLKRRGVSKRTNMAVTLAVDVLMAFALIGGLMFLAFRFNWFGGEAVDTYFYQQENWDVEPIAIPMSLLDLTGEHFDHIRRDEYAHGSLLLPIREYREAVLRESDQRRISWSYTIQEPKTQRLYALVLEDLLAEDKDGGDGTWVETSAWQTEDPASWGAERVWQQYRDAKPADKWILCWPGRIVLIWPDETPSEEEMSRIGQALCP